MKNKRAQKGNYYWEFDIIFFLELSGQKLTQSFWQIQNKREHITLALLEPPYMTPAAVQDLGCVKKIWPCYVSRKCYLLTTTLLYSKNVTLLLRDSTNQRECMDDHSKWSKQASTDLKTFALLTSSCRREKDLKAVETLNQSQFKRKLARNQLCHVYLKKMK